MGPRPVLVTGASGFVGAAVVRSLLRRGYPVRALLRRPTAYSAPAGVQV
ncbi:MAG: NAD-dependent epimerase/dehydratase family protein, partial [Acidimicrobiales bacterium]